MMMDVVIILGLLSTVLFRPTAVEIRRRELPYGYEVLGSALLRDPVSYCPPHDMEAVLPVPRERPDSHGARGCSEPQTPAQPTWSCGARLR